MTTSLSIIESKDLYEVTLCFIMSSVPSEFIELVHSPVHNSVLCGYDHRKRLKLSSNKESSGNKSAGGPVQCKHQGMNFSGIWKGQPLS